MRPTDFTGFKSSAPEFFSLVRPGFIAALLLALFWWLALSASTRWSQTSDELAHITAGFAYDRFGDYRMHSENGILPQRLFGLPPMLLDARFNMDPGLWARSTYWQLGWDFFYGLGNPVDRIVWWARFLNALFGVALGAFVYLVARRWHGPGGGLVALAFFVLCPNFLAHSALATSDLAAVLFLTLAPWFFWRHLERRDLPSGLLAGVLGGLALTAKFNGILLAPIYAVLAISDAWLRPGGARGLRLGQNLLFCLGQGLASALMVWVLFGFRYSAVSPAAPPFESFAWPWAEMLRSLGWKTGFIQTALDWKLMPEAWLYGLTNVLAGEAARPAFFAGQYSLHGWWYFFPAVFLTKTPLAMLGALALTLTTAIGCWRKLDGAGRRSSLVRLMPLAVTAGVVVLTAIASHLNIGHRHILAVYPVLFVALGGLAARGTRWWWVALVLLAGQAVESFAIRPHYLAFFNFLGGGPEKAYRLAVDSSLDWGQDLPALHDWLTENRRPGEPVYLSYFGSAWPPHYGVRPTHFLPAMYIARPPLQRYEYVPGLYCVSATSLAEVYSGFPGPWRNEWEQLFQSSSRDSEIFDRVRFARLCKYLQRRPPEANAGYSILIFRLGEDELKAALAGPVKGW